MSRKKFLLLALAVLMLISPAPTPYGHTARAWKLTDSMLEPLPIPPDARPLAGPTSLDFDSDGIPETLTLANSQAALYSDGQIRWQSPPAWQVRQAQVADLNRDGLPEVVLLVWRPFKPWPVDAWLPNGGRINSFHDSGGMSCHIILIGWYRNSFRERWAGSALAEPVKTFAVADLTGSGKQFLVTLESVYDDPPSAPARQLEVWEWNGFGFTIVSKTTGSFSQLEIARAENGQILILAP
jgi:hypothetical protein